MSTQHNGGNIQNAVTLEEHDGTLNAKRVVVVSDTDSMGEYSTNHIDDYTTTSVTYFGKEDKDGNWYMMKIDETGNFPVFTYATVTNNPTLTTYALAWAARTTATYEAYSAAF